MSTYGWVLILSAIFPFVLSFDKKVAFYRNWRYMWQGLLITAAFFIIIDALFVYYGIWGFSQEHVGNLSLYGLPIEEILFFIVVPYCCLFTYDVLNIYFPKLTTRIFQWSSVVLISLFVLLSMVFYDRIYSLVYGTFAIFFALILQLILKPEWIWRYYRSYFVCLIPFLLVNGVLTGAITEVPVVWYNNLENSFIRIHTIPIEDMAYGFLLIGMNITFYEFFKSRTKK